MDFKEMGAVGHKFWIKQQDSTYPALWHRMSAIFFTLLPSPVISWLMQTS